MTKIINSEISLKPSKIEAKFIGSRHQNNRTMSNLDHESDLGYDFG
jgi:hypothetical protein